MSIYSILTLLGFFIILYNINLHIGYKKIIFLISIGLIYLLFLYEGTIYSFLHIDSHNMNTFQVSWNALGFKQLFNYYFIAAFLEESIKVFIGISGLYLILKLSKEKNIKQKVIPILFTTFFLSVLSFITIENILYIENQNVYNLGNNSYLEGSFIQVLSEDDKQLIKENHIKTGKDDGLFQMFILRSVLSAIQHFTYTGIILLGLMFFIRKRIKWYGMILFGVLGITLHAFINILITLKFTTLYFIWFIISIFILTYIYEIYEGYSKKEDY